MNRLPDKPSELIRTSIRDLVLCELDPKYEIDMADWHVPYFTDEACDNDDWSDANVKTCNVCLAGAVMSKTLGYDISYKANC